MRNTRECGMVTAEYTVGSLGAAFIALWLWRIGAGSGPDNPIGKMIRGIFDHVADLGSTLGGPDWAWRWMS